MSTETKPPQVSLASSTAICVPTRTLFFTRAMFDFRLAPPVSSAMRCSKNGVVALPAMPRKAASCNAFLVAASTAAPSAAASAGTGTYRAFKAARWSAAQASACDCFQAVMVGSSDGWSHHRLRCLLTATTRPPRPRPLDALTHAAASSAESTRAGARMPLRAV